MISYIHITGPLRLMVNDIIIQTYQVCGGIQCLYLTFPILVLRITIRPDTHGKIQFRHSTNV